MSKPITKIASEATHGNSSVESPTKYVNKMEAKSSQMIHKSWPKLEEGFKEGVKNAKEEAMLNTKPITEEDVCGEGFQKRSIIIEPKFGGKICDPNASTKKCFIKECPKKGIYSCKVISNHSILHLSNFILLNFLLI